MALRPPHRSFPTLVPVPRFRLDHARELVSDIWIGHLFKEHFSLRVILPQWRAMTDFMLVERQLNLVRWKQ